MTPEEIKALEDAIAQYALSDVLGARLLSLLLASLTDLGNRVVALETTRRKVAQVEEGVPPNAN